MGQITTGTLEEAHKRISKVCKDLNIDFDEYVRWYIETGKCKIDYYEN